MKMHADLIDDISSCKVSSGQVAFWWLGQHSFVIKVGTSIVYIDPFLSELPGRQVRALLEPGEVTNATAILGSHDHIDHIDHGALPGILLASPAAPLIIPEAVRVSVIDRLELDPARVTGIDAGQTIKVKDVTIHAIPAAHEHLDRDPTTGRHPYLGFILQSNGLTVYHAGDTCIYEGIHNHLRQYKIDLAFLPINGRDAKRFAANIIGNMTYQEAVDLAGSIGFGMTVPAHFEMFAGNSVDPQPFIDYIRVKYPNCRAMIPKHGERCIVAVE